MKNPLPAPIERRLFKDTRLSTIELKGNDY